MHLELTAAPPEIDLSILLHSPPSPSPISVLGKADVFDPAFQYVGVITIIPYRGLLF